MSRKSTSVQVSCWKFICELGSAVLGAEDERCCVRHEYENANSVPETHLFFPPSVTTLKSNILVQLFSFTLPARITASSVKHMSAGEKKKSVGESSAEAKGNAKLNITSFLVSGDAVFPPLQENMK